MKQWKINSGVFSRSFCFDRTYSLIYHTPSQTVVLLEDDSAEVWNILFSSNVNLNESLQYIVANGDFESNPEIEAAMLLDQFLQELEKSNLVTSDSDCSGDYKPEETKQVNYQNINEDNYPEEFLGQHFINNHLFTDLSLELTYRCNEKCVHCYVPSTKNTKELSLKQIEKLLNEFVELGGFRLYLTGGEIFVRNDIEEILDLIAEYNFVTTVSSNLISLTDKLLNKVEKLKPRYVACSIYSMNEGIHDNITGVKDSLKSTINSIKLLRNQKIPVVIKTPVMSLNAECLVEIEKFANQVGCEYQFDLGITAKNDGNLQPTDLRILETRVLEDILALDYFKNRFNKSHVEQINSERKTASICGAGNRGLCIQPDGIVKPCIGLNLPMGTWPNKSLKEIWENSTFFKEWQNVKAIDAKGCGNCEAYAFCSRCPGAWRAETGSHLKPNNYTCFIANTIKEIYLKKKGGEASET